VWVCGSGGGLHTLGRGTHTPGLRKEATEGGGGGEGEGAPVSLPVVHLLSWAKSPAQGWAPQNLMLMHFLPPARTSSCLAESYFHA